MNWTLILVATIGLVGTVFGGWVALRIARMESTTNKVHTLVNSAFETQLRLTAVMALRLANLTNHETDIEAAVMASKKLHEHEAATALAHSE